MAWQKRIGHFFASRTLAAGILGFLLSLFATEILFLVPNGLEPEVAGFLLVPIVFLMVVVAGFIEELRNRWWKWRRIISPIRVGVLGPFFDESKNGAACKTQFSPNTGWLDFFDKVNVEKKQFDVREINWSEISNKFLVLVNPFGEIYLEEDKLKFATYEKIKDFIAKGGIFCCTGGFPFYYFWNEIIGKEIDTTPKTRLISSGTIADPRFFNDSLVSQDFGAIISDVPSKPTLSRSYQDAVDKEYFGDLSSVGGSGIVWEFRSLSEETMHIIPGLRIKHKNETKYALSAIPYGKGFIIIAGMALKPAEVEFKKLGEGLVSFTKLIAKREKTRDQSRYEKLSKEASILKKPSAAALSYLAISAMLSLLIFLRLNVSPENWVKNANVTFYFLMYIVCPAIAVWYSITSVINYNKKHPNYKRSLRIYLAYLAVLSAAIFFIVLLLSANGVPIFDWLFLVIPVFLGYFTFVTLNVKTQTFRKKKLVLLGVIFLISAFLPVGSAFVSQEIVLAHIANVPDSNQKIQVIGDLTRYNLGTYNYFRSSSDYWKYLIVGTGACYEGAMASTTLLKNAGFEARIISLPGEDHVFTEVKINGTWMVIDPGYGDTSPVSRQERADARLREMGAISYVVAYTGSNFTELTSQYVPTDTITIKLTNKGQPLPNAEIYLTHEFQNRSLRLPDAEMSFTTNATGEVTLHMGALTYNQNANLYEDYYWVYVNGQKTGYNITSTGTNENRLIAIDSNYSTK